MATMQRQKIREFIKTSFLFRESQERLSDEESLLAAGLIDSTGILELVSFLESEFDLLVEDAEIVPENLDSVAQISAYVAAKQAEKAPIAIAV